MCQPCFCLFFKKICASNFITEATRMRRVVFKDYFTGVSYWYGDVQKCVADTCSEDRNRCGCHFIRSGRVSYDACKRMNSYCFWSCTKRRGRSQTAHKKGIETARLNGKIIGRPKGQHSVSEREVRAKRQMMKSVRSVGDDIKKIVNLWSKGF